MKLIIFLSIVVCVIGSLNAQNCDVISKADSIQLQAEEALQIPLYLQDTLVFNRDVKLFLISNRLIQQRGWQYLFVNFEVSPNGTVSDSETEISGYPDKKLETVLMAFVKECLKKTHWKSKEMSKHFPSTELEFNLEKLASERKIIVSISPRARMNKLYQTEFFF